MHLKSVELSLCKILFTHHVTWFSCTKNGYMSIEINYMCKGLMCFMMAVTFVMCSLLQRGGSSESLADTEFIFIVIKYELMLASGLAMFQILQQ